MRPSVTHAASALAFIAAVVAYASLFGVHQTEQALLLRFGEPIRVILEPGLNVKWPFIDRVVYIDRRVLDLEAPVQEMIASDQKRLIVDAFVRYRIHDPLKFYQTVNSVEGANSRLSTLAISSLRRVLGESSFIKVVRDERPQLTGRMREQVDREATAMGISVVDLRIRRADLPEQNSQAVYQRMQTERQREAAEFRALGNERAQEILARADREVTVLVAEANSKSEQIRGQGDAERNAIFAAAFGRDQDFFTFYRTIQAYGKGFASEDTRMLLKPNSDFFQFFGNEGGKPQAKQVTRSAPE
jgi:membrane protease subunit HflC